MEQQTIGASLRRSRRELLRATGIALVLYAVTAYPLWQLLPPWPLEILMSIHAVTLVSSTAVLSWHIVSIPEYRKTIAFEEEQRRTRLSLIEEAERRDFSSRISRAMDHVDDEASALRVFERALDLVVGPEPAQVLLADSSRSHLKTKAVSGSGNRQGCAVPTPQGCAALREGRTLVFESNSELDACPHLVDRAGGPCSAVCVPVTVMGQSIGVVHTTAPDGVRPSDRTVEDLETLARTAGGRISMLRVFAETQVQATTDPLTGLLNRRSIERELRLLMRASSRFTMVLADLDHFKAVNDTHGHEIGDRALRLFSDVLRTSLRPDDSVCRYGGEEFLIVMPATSPDEAMWALGRVREDLVLRLTSAEVPAFTSSFGVSEWSPGQTAEEAMARADQALMAAKEQGRNRIVVAGEANAAATDEDATEAGGSRKRPAVVPAD